MKKILLIASILFASISQAQQIGYLPTTTTPSDSDATILHQGNRPGCKKNYKLRLDSLKNYILDGYVPDTSSSLGDTLYTNEVRARYSPGTGQFTLAPDSFAWGNNEAYFLQKSTNGPYEGYTEVFLNNPTADYSPKYDNYCQPGQYSYHVFWNDSTMMSYGLDNQYHQIDFYNQKTTGDHANDLYFNNDIDLNVWNIGAISNDTIAINTVTFHDGKISAPGGIDPPYMSFSLETRDGIKKRSKKCKDDIMLFYNSNKERLEIYVKNEDKFYKYQSMK